MKNCKSRLAAILAMMLVVSLMVAMFVVPVSAAEVKLDGYQAVVPLADLAAAVFEWAGVDLGDYASYQEMGASLLSGGGSATCNANLAKDHLYAPLSLVNQVLSKAPGAASVSVDDLRVYYKNGNAVMVPIAYSGSFVSIASGSGSVGWVYHTNSAFVNAVPEDGLSAVLDQVVGLLPVVLVVLIGFIALRKGISFLRGLLGSA